MLIIRLLMPKGLFTRIGLALLLTAIIVEIGPRLRNLAGLVALTLVIAAAVLLCWKLPLRWQAFWLERSRWVRALTHALVMRSS